MRGEIMAKVKELAKEDELQTTVDEERVSVNPGLVRIQNLQSIEQTIPLIDGGEPICLTPFRGKGNTSRPVLNRVLPTAFVERLIREKKIRKLV